MSEHGQLRAQCLPFSRDPLGPENCHEFVFATPRPEDQPCTRCPVPSANPGKIERSHHTLKNRILLENCFMPGDLEAQIEAFVLQPPALRDSLANVTPADAYFGRAPAIITQRERIKRQTI